MYSQAKNHPQKRLELCKKLKDSKEFRKGIEER